MAIPSTNGTSSPPKWRSASSDIASNLAALLLVGLLAADAAAGTIRGIVVARGREAPGGGDGGAYASRKYKFMERMNYDEVKDFVVFVEAPWQPEFAGNIKPVRVVVQQNAMFSPHVMPVLVGTEVEWPNDDDIFHNVFSFSDPKPFDLGLYKDETKKIHFDRPGRVDVFCSIHKNMSCIILVLENPWFASTDARGRYSIPDVPAGTYRVKAWHERLPPDIRDVTVPAEGAVEVNFELGVKGLPTY